MTKERSIQTWARSARFAQPLSWGEVEAGILAREPHSHRGRLSPGMALRVSVSWLGIVLFGLLIYGSSLIGLTVVLLGAIGEDASWDWTTPARVAFTVAVLTEVVFLLIWWEIRRRPPLVLPVSALTVLASSTTYGVLLGAADEGSVSWLPLLVLAAAASGVAMLATGFLSQPEGRARSRKPPLRGPRKSRLRDDYLAARARVLDILTERGVVDLHEADRKRVLEMPLGYWDELDGLDEREWRRVLELRLVGWREFDGSDRRPWPPTAGGPVDDA